nr:hypothetical protein [Tanacetum cinerariifolium]
MVISLHLVAGDRGGGGSGQSTKVKAPPPPPPVIPIDDDDDFIDEEDDVPYDLAASDDEFHANDDVDDEVDAVYVYSSDEED